MPISKIKTTGVDLDNLEIGGTEGARMPVGTTGERESSPKKGDIRFNDTTDLMEYYTGVLWKSIDSPPTISTISPLVLDKDSTTDDITITGSNYQSGATVQAIGTDGSIVSASSVVVNSSTTITATFQTSSFQNSLEPYDVRVTNPSALTGILEDVLNVNSSPTWVTAANLGEVGGGETFSISLSASDPESDSLTYSSSDAPSGSSVASNGTFSGTADEVTSDTTKTFTASVTDGNKTANRTFNILYGRPAIQVNGSGQFINTAYSISTQGYYTIVPDQTLTVFIDLWGAGGGGGSNGNYDARGGAGGEAYGVVSLTAGTTYIVLVGQGGRDAANTRSFPDGGSVNTNGFNSGGSGGGGSTRFGAYTQSGFNLTNSDSNYNNTNAVYYMIAGGGGGTTGYTDGTGGNMADQNGGPNGYGGGLTGAGGDAWYAAGESSSSIGQGGTQSAGGAGGTQGRLSNVSGADGAKYYGGNSSAGGGGGGYYGGGGSQGYYAFGGGGSGFLNSSFVTNGAFATASSGVNNNYISPNANSLRPTGTAGYGGLTNQTAPGSQGFDGAFVIQAQAYRS